MIWLANFVSVYWTWIAGTVLTLAIAASSEENYRARRKFSGPWNFRLNWDEQWRSDLLDSCESEGDLISTGKVHLNYESQPHKEYSGIGLFQLEAGGKIQRHVAVELVRIRIGIRRQGLSFGYRLLRCELSTVFVQTENCQFVPPKREYHVVFEHSDQSVLRASIEYKKTVVGFLRGGRR